MGAIINGIGVGFFAAIFIAIYAEGLFNYLLPIWIIYGILAPFFSAVAIAAFVISSKKERRNLEWFEEKED